MHRLVIIAVATAFGLLLSNREAIAQSATCSLVIATLSIEDNAPLAFVPVQLFGQRSLRGLTGPDGQTTFTGLPCQEYEVEAGSADYKLVGTSRRVRLNLLSTRVVLHFRTLTRPATIARTQSKSSRFRGATARTADPYEQMTNSALAGVTTLPGVTLSGGQLSVLGHSAAQTSVMINGVPVFAFGAKPDLGLFATDLFGAVGLNTSAANGSPGGALDFQTREPTLDWLGNVNVAEGRFGSQAKTLLEEGTLGRLGLSYTHASHDQGQPLDGMTFLDSSGATYSHDGVDHTTGDALKMRYPFSQSSVLTASFVSISAVSPLVCTTFTGLVPCGFGPGNTNRASLTSAQIRDSASVGNISGQVTFYHNNVASAFDGSHLLVGGTSHPQVGSSRTDADGIALASDLTIGLDHHVDVNLTIEHDTNSSSGEVFGRSAISLLPSFTYSSASISADILRRGRLSTQATLGFQSQGGEKTVNGAINGDYVLSNHDTVSISYAAGALGSPTIAIPGVGPATSLEFNCAADNALGFGPEDASGDTTVSTAGASWKHQSDYWNASIEASHEVDRRAPVYGIINALGLPSTLLPPGYLATASATMTAACGRPSTLSYSDLYFTVSGIADYAAFDNLRISAGSTLGRNVSLQGSYTVSLARASGSGPVFSPFSTVLSGHQLPERPIYSGNLAVAAALGRSRVKLIADLGYVGANNGSNLPAYATLNVGLNAKLSNGEVTVSMLNVTNAHAGVFSTGYGATPISLGNGGSYRPILHPLTPVSVNVSYRLPVGRSDVTNAQEGTFPANRIGWGYHALDAAPPSPDGIGIARDSFYCGPEMLGAANHYQDALRRYKTQIEGKRSPSGDFPESVEPYVDGPILLVYRRIGSSYAILVERTPNSQGKNFVAAMRPFTGCTWSRSPSLDEARRANLYLATHDEQKSRPIFMTYMPGFGAYHAPSLIENAPVMAYTAVPKVPPLEPFSVSGATCSESLRSAATSVGAVLAAYASAYYAHPLDSHSAPEYFTIIPHVARGGTWLEIAPFDEFLFAELQGCFSVAYVSKEELDGLGIGSSHAAGTIDYAPQVGLFQGPR